MGKTLMSLAAVLLTVGILTTFLYSCGSGLSEESDFTLQGAGR